MQIMTMNNFILDNFDDELSDTIIFLWFEYVILMFLCMHIQFCSDKENVHIGTDKPAMGSLTQMFLEKWKTL